MNFLKRRQLSTKTMSLWLYALSTIEIEKEGIGHKKGKQKGRKAE